MNIYYVSNYSKCGSYFSDYLQYVLIVAPSKERALELCKQSKKFGSHQNWHCEIQSDIEIDPKFEGQVILYHYASDY